MAGLSAAEIDDVLAILFRLNESGITVVPKGSVIDL